MSQCSRAVSLIRAGEHGLESLSVLLCRGFMVFSRVGIESEGFWYPKRSAGFATASRWRFWLFVRFGVCLCGVV